MYKVLVASAGPSINIFLAVLIYFLPSFNEQLTCVYANLLIGLFNLIPIYPLDGGRIIKSVLKMFNTVDIVEKTMHNISVLCLCIITFFGAIGIIYLQNISIIMIISYLWFIYLVERKKYKIKMRVYNIVNNV